MWRRHSIAARKASGDAKKSRIYAKIWRIIQMAAKNGADASMNPGLELALQKARYYGLPRDVIDKAILKWSGQLEWDVIQEIVYEGYGPGGSALVIKSLTDNINRSAMNIKVILWKVWWSLWKPGSVARKFEETGVFVIDGKTERVLDKWNEVEKTIAVDPEEAELELMDLPIKDIDIEDDKIIITCEKTNFSAVQKWLKEQTFHVIEGALHFIAKDEIALSPEDKTRLWELLEQLEDDDDVSEVFSDVK